MPRLNGSLITCAPARAATCAVRSVEPSSTTTTSKSGACVWMSPIVPAIAPASLYAGTMARSLVTGALDRERGAAGKVAARPLGERLPAARDRAGRRAVPQRGHSALDPGLEPLARRPADLVAQPADVGDDARRVIGPRRQRPVADELLAAGGAPNHAHDVAHRDPAAGRDVDRALHLAVEQRGKRVAELLDRDEVADLLAARDGRLLAAQQRRRDGRNQTPRRLARPEREEDPTPREAQTLLAGVRLGRDVRGVLRRAVERRGLERRRVLGERLVAAPRVLRARACHDRAPPPGRMERAQQRERRPDPLEVLRRGP